MFGTTSVICFQCYNLLKNSNIQDVALVEWNFFQSNVISSNEKPSFILADKNTNIKVNIYIKDK